MELLDNLKVAIQSGKEKAIIDSVMAMFGSQIRAVKPENTISTFIDLNVPALFVSGKDQGGEFDAMAGLVAKLLVAEANEDPEYAYLKLKDFVLQFQIWYVKHVKVSEMQIDQEE